MKRKILFITYNLKLGGANSTLYDLVRLLDKNKYDITIFTIHDGGSWEPRFREAGIRVVNSYSHMKGGNGIWGRIKNRLELKKIERLRKHMGKGLISHCLKEEFDLAVLQHSYEPFELTPFMPGAATVRYIHGDVKNNSRYREVLEQSSQYFKDYDRIICVSQVAEQSFREAFGCEEQTVVCYNPIDSELLLRKSRETATVDLSFPYICVVGRLAPEKGVERLVRIHARLIRSGLKHRLVIVGDGPELATIRKAIDENGVNESVLLAGYQDNPYPYIRNSLFTVCPSYSEGLHMASMESLCLGIPVVAAVEPVGELFGHECCGIITENDDESLEAGIRKMLVNRSFYEMAKQGAERRGGAFRSDAMIARVEAVFDEAIAKRCDAKE